MARIEINDLEEEREISDQEMKAAFGGLRSGQKTLGSRIREGQIGRPQKPFQGDKPNVLGPKPSKFGTGFSPIN